MFHRIPLKWLFLTASLMGLPVPAFAAQPQPGALQALQSPAPAEHGRGGKLAGLLSPEQRAMFMLDAREQLKGMTPDQRKAWRKDQIQKVMAMSPDQRQAFQSNLQARWDALPAARKNRIEQRLAQRETPPPTR